MEIDNKPEQHELSEPGKPNGTSKEFVKSTLVREERKSVGFSSTVQEKKSEIKGGEDCIRIMQEGCPMIKLHSSRRHYNRTYFLSSENSEVFWIPSSKNAQQARIRLVDIREVSCGCSLNALQSYSARRARRQSRERSGLSGMKLPTSISCSPSPSMRYTSTVVPSVASGAGRMTSEAARLPMRIDPSQEASLQAATFTLVFGNQFRVLELLASSPEVAKVWVTGLRFLLATNSPTYNSPDVTSPRRDSWLKDAFFNADVEDSGFLEDGDVLRLTQTLNPTVADIRIKQKLREAASCDRSRRGTMTADEFVTFYKEVATRPELFFLMAQFSNDAETLTANDLQIFLAAEQGVFATVPECFDLIQKYEPAVDFNSEGKMSIDGFTAYLLSEAGGIFSVEHSDVCQDMSQPLPHYFISASNKTFLMEDQLNGLTSTEGYRRALLAGYRYIEMEVCDGNLGSPVVYRSNTRTSELVLVDVLETIKRFAFVTSEYPLILSIENHCSPSQQGILYDELLLHLGDSLYLTGGQLRTNNSNFPNAATMGKQEIQLQSDGISKDLHPLPFPPISWPSPRDAMGKILLKGRKLQDGTAEPEGIILEEDNIYETKHAAEGIRIPLKEERKLILLRKLSDLFFVDSQPFRVEPICGPHKHYLEHNVFNATLRHRLQSAARRRKRSDLGMTIQSIGTFTSKVNAKSDCHEDTSDMVASSSSLAVALCLAEAAANLTCGSTTEQLIRAARDQLVTVCPGSSRCDSSNQNPVPVWAWGGQLALLNLQTAGPPLDIASGFFAQNGGCGYVLKPPHYRFPFSFLNISLLRGKTEEQYLPDVVAKVLSVRIISAQQLPKPRGSAVKGHTVEPYVVVQVFGIPADRAEACTKTAKASNATPRFDESFDFRLCLPDMALLRFVVLDDDSIGDDFIGQCTVPVSCLRTGYRHVTLRDEAGECMPSSTIFVHISMLNESFIHLKDNHISNTTHSKLVTRQRPILKRLSIAAINDTFKPMVSMMNEAHALRVAAYEAFGGLQLTSVQTVLRSSIVPSLLILTRRLAATVGSQQAAEWPVQMRVRHQDGLPHLQWLPGMEGAEDMATLPRGMRPNAGGVRFRLRRRPSLQVLCSPLEATSVSVDGAPETPLTDTASISSETTPKSLSIPVPTISNASTQKGPPQCRLQQLQRVVKAYETLITKCKALIQHGPYLREKMVKAQQSCSEAYLSVIDIAQARNGEGGEASMGDTISSLASSRTLRSSQLVRLSDTFAWNMRVLMGQIELLDTSLADANAWVRQAREFAAMIGYLSPSPIRINAGRHPATSRLSQIIPSIDAPHSRTLVIPNSLHLNLPDTSPKSDVSEQERQHLSLPMQGTLLQRQAGGRCNDRLYRSYTEASDLEHQSAGIDLPARSSASSFCHSSPSSSARLTPPSPRACHFVLSPCLISQNPSPVSARLPQQRRHSPPDADVIKRLSLAVDTPSSWDEDLPTAECPQIVLTKL